MESFDKTSLWDSILSSDIFKNIDINSFKNEGANSRITQYSCKTHGILFLKNLLFQMASSFKKKDLDLLKNIPNRNVGGGIDISYDDLTFDLDYLLALEEILFLREHLKSSRTILEIGAGYGRTCHSILSLFPNIEEYNILDLPNVLALSQKYLLKVSSEDNSKKVKFHSVNEVNKTNISTYDLIINIDSMQEMPSQTVCTYLDYIDKNAQLFYTKNTIGKFSPSTCGWENTKNSELAMNSGILRDLVNIFSPKDLSIAQEKFIKSFRPSNHWNTLKVSNSLPWSHYYQVLYEKNI